ncbi:ganglioside-induced differentiation-associated protein 1 isoform X1 [Homalodisca vitripennis]|uniref:GST N-terminal domain-containing protein n=2 Tax=Homalodisca TaxID=139475 RepID=A0A1B6IUJ9_9HEMI|nr:ganglioside-induced differentiation-associated protein 1 isoform X1 [Homalodisca vitripennis]
MFFSQAAKVLLNRLCALKTGQCLCVGYVYNFSYFSNSNSNLQDRNLNSNYHTDVKVMAATGSEAVSSPKEQEKGNGLLLYLNNYSFYAQKVIMALMEKRLPFKSQVVNIAKGEQYQPWFLDINPRGEVPVLKDGVKIIPDSARIIDYLEDNFSNGDTRLIPLDQGPEIRQRVLHFRNLLDPIPANVITIGSFLHPKFVGKPKAPFIAPVRKALVAGEEKNVANLRKLAEKHPNIKRILLEKAEVQEKKHQLVMDEASFEKLLDQVDTALQEVEKELASRSENDPRWLCSERFTVADISLTILLDRLYLLGLETRYWSDGKKPGIARYYARVCQRDTYKQTVPSQITHLKTFLEMQPGLVIGTVIFTAIAVIIGGFLFLKKK